MWEATPAGEAGTPLGGGRVTSGVVRIGDTVRRPPSGDSVLRRELLADLEKQSFRGVQRFLGVDGEGREVLSFLPGDVPAELGPHGDGQLAAAASLLRRFHDAGASRAARSPGAEVICHNDWAPTNAVFRDGMPYAMIDFDTLAPGQRIWDLGYSAWTWLDIGNADYTSEEQLRRLALFALAYDPGADLTRQLVTSMLARQMALAVRNTEAGEEPIAKWAVASAVWTVANLLSVVQPGG